MKRKFLAILTASVMALSMVTPAFATLPSTGYGVVVGEGEIGDAVWPGDIFGGVLPVSGTLNFAIDPYGHLNLAVGQEVTKALRQNEIYFTNPYIGVTNTSSAPVIVTAALQLTGEESAAAPVAGAEPLTDATLVAVEATAGEPAPRNVMFWMELNHDVLDSLPAEAADNFTPVGDDGLVVPFGTTAVNALFELPAIDTVVRVQATTPDLILRREARNDDDRNGTAFRLGGIFNRHASWTGSPAIDLRVRATFTMVQVYAEADGIDTHAEAFGLITAGTNITRAGENVTAPPTTVARPATTSPPLRTEPQEAAYVATGAANTARDDANTARTVALDTAISTFNDAVDAADPDPVATSYEEALQEAISNAKDALETAQGALSDAQEALEIAVGTLNDADVNRTRLATAVEQLQTAVTALADRIGEAEELLGGEQLFTLSSPTWNTTTSFTITVPLEGGAALSWTESSISYTFATGGGRVTNDFVEMYGWGTTFVNMVAGADEATITFLPALLALFDTSTTLGLHIELADGTEIAAIEIPFAA